MTGPQEDDGAVLIDAMKALDALRVGSGAHGRSPTLGGQGGRLTSLGPLASTTSVRRRARARFVAVSLWM